MRIALLTDIHANAAAFRACLAEARAVGFDRIALLGDFVGYGPDPVEVVEMAAGLVADGAIAIKGNHDEAAVKPISVAGMNENAARAIEWTRDALETGHKAFLDGLPMQATEADMLFVHASAREPARWPYILDREAAAACLAATDRRLVFCGHTHIPAIYHSVGKPAAGKAKPEHFRPKPRVAVPFSRVCRYVCVIGAVGQPRDRNPAACWSLLDTTEATLTMHRAVYDVEATMRRIMDVGLPEWLGKRLTEGV